MKILNEASKEATELSIHKSSKIYNSYTSGKIAKGEAIRLLEVLRKEIKMMASLEGNDPSELYNYTIIDIGLKDLIERIKAN